MTTPDTTARKKNSAKRQRNLVLRVRVLPSESEEIRKRATALGVSVSEMLRESALNEPIRRPKKPLPSPDRMALAALTGQLGKIGSNLNQLAHRANTSGVIGEWGLLTDAICECRDLMFHMTDLLR